MEPEVSSSKNSFLNDKEKKTMIDMVNSKLDLGQLGWKVFSVRTTDFSEITLEV